MMFLTIAQRDGFTHAVPSIDGVISSQEPAICGTPPTTPWMTIPGAEWPTCLGCQAKVEHQEYMAGIRPDPRD